MRTVEHGGCLSHELSIAGELVSLELKWTVGEVAVSGDVLASPTDSLSMAQLLVVWVEWWTLY